MNIFLDPSLIFLTKRPTFPGLAALSFYFFGPTGNSAALVTILATTGSILSLYAVFSKSYNVQTGLLFVIAVVTSTYIVTAPAHLVIDHTMFFFMAFGGLLLTYIALHTQSKMWAFLSGMVLGVGFLTKEVSVLWFPLTFYLACGVKEWRTSKSILLIFLNLLGTILIIGSWSALNLRILDNIIRFGEYQRLFIFFVLSIIIVAVISVILYFTLRNRLSLSILQQERFSALWAITGWVGWLVITSVFTILLTLRTGPEAHFTSIEQLIPRFYSFLEYMDVQTVWQPYLIYLPFALIIVLISAILRPQQGDKILLWVSLALVPLALMNLSGAYVLKTRYGMPIFWVSYVILGRAIALIVELVAAGVSRLFSGGVRTKAYQGVFTFGALLIALISLGTAFKIPREYAYFNSPYYGSLNENNETLRTVGGWLKENVPDDAILASTSLHNDILNFYGSGEYKIHDMSETALFNLAADLTTDLEQVSHAFYFDIRLRNNQNALEFYPGSSLVDKENIPDLTYIQPGRRPQRYAVFSEEAFFNRIQELEVDYLILDENALYRGLNHIPKYFHDNPAYTLLYSTRWTSVTNRVYKVHIYKIDREQLRYIDYPLMIERRAWPKLYDEYRQLAGGFADSYEMMGELFDHKIVRIQPRNSKSYVIYEMLANDYLNRGNFKRAALYYHYAHDLYGPKRTFPAGAKELLSEKPDSAASQLLQGDRLKKQGQLELARKAFNSVLGSDVNDDEIIFAAYKSLAEIDLSQEEFRSAVEHYENAMNHATFGRSEVASRRWIAEGLQEIEASDLTRNIEAVTSASSAFQDAIDAHPSSAIPTLLTLRNSASEVLVKNFYNGVLESATNSIEGHQELVKIYRHPKRAIDSADPVLNKLLVTLESAAVNDPYNTSNHLYLTQLYKKLGEPQQIIPIYQKQLELWPEDLELRYKLGQTLQSVDDTEGATEAYWSILRINPGFIAAYQQLKQIYLDADNVNDLVELNQFLENSSVPDFALHIELGKTYLEQASLEQTITK